MKPVLSIIVPARNANDTLPELLESIAAQRLPVETIVVDDCSEEPCEDLALSFRGPHQDVCYIRPPKQVFMRGGRLLGLEAARAEVVTFADADDAFYGTGNLGEAIELFHRFEPDILHCNAIDTAATQPQEWFFSRPVAAELVGWDIIREFTVQFRAWNVWGKFYRRSLWRDVIPKILDVPIQNACEDMSLVFPYVLHAKHYIGELIPVYRYHWKPDISMPRTFGRLLGLDIIRRSFIPYMRKNDCPENIVSAMDANLIKLITLWMMYCFKDFSLLRKQAKEAAGDTVLPEALAAIPPKELLHILLQANAAVARLLAECSRLTAKLEE